MKVLSLPYLFLNILGIVFSSVISSSFQPAQQSCELLAEYPHFIQLLFLLNSFLGCLAKKVKTFVMILLITNGIAYVHLKTRIEMAC